MRRQVQADLARDIAGRLPHIWRGIRAVELALEECGAELNADALLPGLREVLDELHADIRELHEKVRVYVALELTEPDEEEIDRVWQMIERGAG